MRNNLLAVLAALIFVIPNILEIRLEDAELIEQFGGEHRLYVGKTPALLPHCRDLGGLLRLVLRRDLPQ